MSNALNISDLNIVATACTPAVNFSFGRHHLMLSGESYPENAAAFYRPIVASLQDFLDQLSESGLNDADLPPLEIHVSLTYFNSSSTKMLFSLFSVLNQAAERGLSIALHWYYHQEDDITGEFGEELHIDFPALAFHPHALE
ncbi:DUF1987 domain-containing protein [Affinibrenneria salicis]|uniref:DUF1987 domain-containing protein n=1 Tax=Affinibrenneria salicis TaxID=2590031 RepID=A0A5J5FU28_9GAMM|nr:DUF1987 domain-containing protein [Affinibrenneria salicis]KAA8996166.1 DUF1987 domain-containing protein [Affinibrenneria salicis]